MEEILQNLANLQYIDSKIDEISRLRGDLPEEIEDVKMDLERLKVRQAKIEEDKTGLESEKINLANLIQHASSLIEKYDKQQTTVRNNREYDALTKEIEAQKQNIENSNSRIEEINNLLVEINEEFEVNMERVEQTQALLEEKRKELDQLVERTASEEKKLVAIRDKAAEKVSPRYLKSYERLRKGLANKIAVVAMDKGAAFGTLLPPQIQVEVKRKGRIIIDENSGRIVVDPSFFIQAKDEYEKHIK